MLTLEAPTEEVTEEDLKARASVGFALDLEPVLPGPLVGSERLLVEQDPEAARRLGLPTQPAPASVSGAMPGESVLTDQPPPPSLLGAHETSVIHEADAVDVEPVLSPPPGEPGGYRMLDSPVTELESLGPPVTDAPVSTLPLPISPPPDLQLMEPPPPTVVAAPVVQRVADARPKPARSPLLRHYPRAFGWAGLGESPWFGPRTLPARAATAPLPLPTSPASLAEDLLDLAAMGKDESGVMEMHLVFKEEVLRGLVCKLRFEAEGLHARFVAPDETVRRYLDGTAAELIERMRRRGMRIGGWTIEVNR